MSVPAKSMLVALAASMLWGMQAQEGGPGHSRVLSDSTELGGNVPDCLELLCCCHGFLDALQSSTIRMDCR